MYFHLATVNSRGVVVTVTDVLKRLGTVCTAAAEVTRRRHVHSTALPVFIGNLNPDMP